MSGWRQIIKNLHRIGGGPARFAQFNGIDAADPAGCLRRAKALGAIRIVAVSPIRYELTPLGWAFCDGRAGIATVPGSKRIQLAYRIGKAPPDELITKLLAEAGKKPGEPVTFGHLQAFSARLVQAVRLEARLK